MIDRGEYRPNPLKPWLPDIEEGSKAEKAPHLTDAQFKKTLTNWAIFFRSTPPLIRHNTT